MAATGGRSKAGLTGVAARLYAEPYSFDFFQAVRLLERIAPTRFPVGRDGPPEAEVVRFRAHLSLTFPPSPVVELLPPEDGRPVPLMTVAFLGLYGPSGTLPPHYTQLLLDIGRDVRGPERRSLRDWLDLFNHRIISHFFRAWEKYRFWVSYERGQSFSERPDPFTASVFSLIGLGTPGTRNRIAVRAREPEASHLERPPALAQVDDLSLLYYAGLFAQRPRNACNLARLIGDYFGIPVAIQEFRGQWLDLAPANQTSLGATGILGMNAVAGSRVWDVSSKFRLRIGPLNYERFEDFLPDTAPIPERKRSHLLAHLTRLFVGPELDFDVQLVLNRFEVPDWPLGSSRLAGPRLGWNVWLCSSPPSHDPDDAAFEGGPLVATLTTLTL